MWFKYVACKVTGETTSGVLEAESEGQAEAALWRSDLTIISLGKNWTPPSIQEALPTLFRVGRADVVYFSRDLATLLNSGIAILPAMNMLYGRTTKKSMKKVLRDILGAVETGSSFSEACARHPEAFSAFYLRMIRVGEEVGNLEVMLRQTTIQMEKEAAITSKIRGAMMYPTFVLAVATLAIFALLYFVIPAMGALFEEIGGNLPTITVVVLAAADFIQAYILYLLLGLIAIVGLVWWARRTGVGKRVWGSLVFKIPVLGTINLKGRMANMARNMATMVRGGITVTESLDMLIQTTDNHPMRTALVKVRSDVHSGEALSVALSKQPIFPALFSQVVGVGETSGRLEANLDTVADFYEAETEKAVSRATNLLGPVLVLGCGGLVGVIALAIYLPIYSLMNQLGL